jgi:hypothetical protein
MRKKVSERFAPAHSHPVYDVTVHLVGDASTNRWPTVSAQQGATGDDLVCTKNDIYN